MIQTINILLLAVIGFCVLTAWRCTLFECALLIGRCFFGLILAMAFVEPAAGYLVGTFSVPKPYASAISFLVIWGLVIAIFSPLVVQIVKEDGYKMKFKHQRPGMIASGLIAGVFASSALAAALVMLPPVESIYLKANQEPVARFHRVAAQIYGLFALTTADPVASAEMEAGAYWTRPQVQELAKKKDFVRAEDLVNQFTDRYHGVAETPAVRGRFDEIVKQLQKVITKAGGKLRHTRTHPRGGEGGEVAPAEGQPAAPVEQPPAEQAPVSPAPPSTAPAPHVADVGEAKDDVVQRLGRPARWFKFEPESPDEEGPESMASWAEGAELKTMPTGEEWVFRYDVQGRGTAYVHFRDDKVTGITSSFP